jgi:Fibronectin type III domain/Abnormal spindle-like microcephaly-assoc'd, ASPM-SPD-2-Hydin/Cysteine-rich secretory protein family
VPTRFSVGLLAVTAVALACLAAVSTPIQASAAGTPDWLVRLNNWRVSTGVSALSENTTWDQGDYNHSLYMVKNNQVTHYEGSTLPYYTPEGDTAAQNGNIEVNSSTAFTDTQAIDWWMAAPFHAMGMMDPRLTSTGFGAYREVKSGWDAGFTLDVLRGNSFTPGAYAVPVFYPGNGATVPLTSYGGNEYPDPLQACSGYTAPTGLPAFIQIGGNVSTTVSAHSFTGDGAALAHCVIDSTNATLGASLKTRGGVIVIPRQPLLPGVQYAVNLTVNGTSYSWSFGVTTSGSFAPGAPTAVTATAGDALATVSWTAPANSGGSPLTSYVVTSYVGSVAQTSATVSAGLTSTSMYGLTNGTTYTFQVAAVNASGTGPAAVSNPVTPMVPPVSATKFLWFGARALTTTSVAQTLTLTNGTAGTITVTSVTLSGANAGDFNKGADNCTAATVAAAGSCTVQFTFTPSGNGVRNATVTFADSGPDNPTVALVGVGGASQAAMQLYFPWYDLSSPGMRADTIHLTNPTGAVATGTISLGGQTPLTFSVGPGMDGYYSFPAGAIGGPVVINSATVPVISSLRAWYYQSFNETPARTLATAATQLYFLWYDLASPGMRADTIHITNESGSAATGTISLPGAATINFSVGDGQDSYFSFPSGTIGGPVTINSSRPVLASLRAWYNQSFNETVARSQTEAVTTHYFPWYDLSNPGMRADTIHVTNVSGATATGTIALPGASSISFSVGNGQDRYFSFPTGTIGGPLTVTSDRPVLATLRAWYYSSFNEVAGRPAGPIALVQYIPWYDLASPGMVADTLHVTNVGATPVSGTIAQPGATTLNFTVAAGKDAYFAFPKGTIGGPVTVTASGPVIVALRAWYYQSFNEVPARY